MGNLKYETYERSAMNAQINVDSVDRTTVPLIVSTERQFPSLYEHFIVYICLKIKVLKKYTRKTSILLNFILQYASSKPTNDVL